jgi:hypothetical protein
MVPSPACRQFLHADHPGQAGDAWRSSLRYTTRWGTISAQPECVEHNLLGGHQTVFPIHKPVQGLNVVVRKAEMVKLPAFFGPPLHQTAPRMGLTI